MGTDLAQGLPSENEDREGESKDAKVCTREEIEFARRALRIQVAACMLEARTYARRRGMTDDMMAGMLKQTVKKWRRTCLDYDNLSLDQISDFMLTTGCHLELTAIGVDKTLYTPLGAVSS